MTEIHCLEVYPSGETRLCRKGRHKPAGHGGEAQRRIVDQITDVGEEGEIITLLAGDESFDGYWRRLKEGVEAFNAKRPPKFVAAEQDTIQLGSITALPRIPLGIPSEDA